MTDNKTTKKHKKILDWWDRIKKDIPSNCEIQNAMQQQIDELKKKFKD